MKKSTIKGKLAALLLAGVMVGAVPCMAMAAEIKDGNLGNVGTYTVQSEGSFLVQAEENTDFHYAVAASYDAEGRMVDVQKVELDNSGEGKLTLQNLGQSVKLFAVSESHAPLCKAVEVWNANGVDIIAESAAELEALIEAGAENEDLVIHVAETADLTDADVDATFNGKNLTIYFNDVDMEDRSLKITAPNAETITLMDHTEGEEGTVIGTLTIDAPNAEVVSHVAAGEVDILAVKDGTFHAKDKVKDKIKIKKGTVEVDHKVADTTVTVPEDADGVKIKGKVNEVNIETKHEVVLDAEVTTANVTAEGANVIGEGSIETANVSAEATVDIATVEKLDVKEPVTVTVGENAVVTTVVVSAEATEEAKAEISGKGVIDIIEAIADVIVSATNVTEVEVHGGITVELHADVEYVNIPAANDAPTIKVEINVTVGNVTTEADVNVTGSGSIENVTVNNNSSEESVTITAPEDSAIKVESIVNTGSGTVEIKNESQNEAELPEEPSAANMVKDTIDEIDIDFATSDEWRTEGYLYQFFDIEFNAAEWAAEEMNWDKVEYYVNGEKFEWIVEGDEPSEPGDFAVEVDIFDYFYDYEAETGTATGLVAAYVKEGGNAQAKPGDEPYNVEIRFPSDHLRVTDKDYVISGKTFTVDLDVNITDSGVALTPAKDELDTIIIDAGTAADWITEGYVYVEKEITFDGAEWSMEPYWEEHVTYWINGKQFQWIPGESVVGEYSVEVDMVPEYDEEGNLSMKAMVFAYMENVANDDSFNMEIRVPTYSLARTDEEHRITRAESAVIDFEVQIEGCENYVPPVVDRVEDIYIDLSASDEWRTEGYLHELFDVDFNAAEWAVTEEDFDWSEVTYWVNGEPFVWDVEKSKPGDFEVEVDFLSYYGNTDEETGTVTGTATGLVAAYVDNVEADSSYEVEIQFPSDYLRITDERYQIKSGDTFTVDFNVHIVDSEADLEPAKDTLKTIPLYMTAADESGNLYAEEEITFHGAAWRMEPYWDEHVTYEVSDDAVDVEMVPRYDEETGELFMDVKVAANVDDVTVGDSVSVKIYVPTYSLVRTDEAYRITRDETAVIDFTVFMSEGEGYVAPVVDMVDDIDIDLSASDEWRTEGYLYQFFDIEFNAAEWAAEEMNWDKVEYYVNGKKFEWIVEGDEPSEPGDFAVEVDIFDYFYDYEAETGTATGLVAAYVKEGGNAQAKPGDEPYNVEIRFPSDHLRVTDENYMINSGETFTVDFDVNIVDSGEALKPAKDTLEEMLLYTKVTDDAGNTYAEKEVTFNGAAWRMEPYWDEHVTYEVSNDAVCVDLIPYYDEETGELFMNAIAEANVNDVTVGENVTVKIFVPTYSLERTDDAYRITRNETGVIDFTVKITDADPFYAEVTGVNIDCYDNGEEVEEGTVIVKFAHENYTEAVTFGLMDHNDDEYVPVTAVFTEEDDYPKGSVTFEMTGVPVADYEVVYLVGNTWFGTGCYIDLTGGDDEEEEKSSLWFEVEEPRQILAGGTAVFDSMLLLRDEPFVEGEEITFTLNDGFSFVDGMSIYDVNNLITIKSLTDHELVILAPSDINGEFGLDGLTIAADADVAVGTKALLTASMEGYTSAKEKIATVVDQIIDMLWLDFAEIEIPAGDEASFEDMCIMKYFEFDANETVTLTLNEGFSFPAGQTLYDGDTIVAYTLNGDNEMVVTAPEEPGNGFDLVGLTIAADASLADGTEAELTVVVDGCAAFKDNVATVGNPEPITDELFLDVEPIEIVAGGTASFDILGVDKRVKFTAGDKVTLTLSEGFSFVENDEFYDGDGTPIAVARWSANEIVVLAPEDPGRGFDLEELTILADASLEEGTTATMTASMDGYDPVSKMVATVVVDDPFRVAKIVFAEGSNTMEVDGYPLTFSTFALCKENDVDYIPMRSAAELLSVWYPVNMSWDTNTMTAYFSLDEDADEELVFTTGSRDAVVNGTTVTMKYPAIMASNGSFSIPLQDLFDLFGESAWTKTDNGIVTATLSVPNNGRSLKAIAEDVLDIAPEEIAELDAFTVKAKPDGFDGGDSILLKVTDGFEFMTHMPVFSNGDTAFTAESVVFDDTELYITLPEDYTEDKIIIEDLWIEAVTAKNDETAFISVSMLGYPSVMEAVATVNGAPAETVSIALVQNGSDGNFYATWDDMGYSGYRIDIGDNSIFVMDGATTSPNLLHFIPCADENTAYDIVLKGLDAEFHATELARLENALVMTVSGSAAEYTAEFSETVVNATWTSMPEGVAYIHELTDSSGKQIPGGIGGGSPITPLVTINRTFNDGDMLDLRVVTAASLDGQVLNVTITPASEKTYVA